VPDHIGEFRPGPFVVPGMTPSVAVAYQLVREVSITFDFPIRDYGQVLLHFWSEEVGRTSLTIGFRVVSLDGTQQYAHGRRVTVEVDPVTQRPAAWSEAGRSDLEALLRPVPETVGG
jgi:acyl-CoA thioester hydrolase